MELFAESYEVQALRDENQWLLQCLHASEQSGKQLQSVIKQQQRRIKKLERAANADQSAAGALIECQWRSHLQQKEQEWMQEYDSQMQSLLRIIQHHESVHAQLEKELQASRSAVGDCVSSATQTDFLGDGGGDDDIQAASDHDSHDQKATQHNGEGCSSCTHASRQQEVEKECLPHPIVIQTSTARTNPTNGLSDFRSRRYHQPSTDREPNFRVSILQRLRRPSPHTLSQSKARSLPPTILEEDETFGEDSDAREERAPNSSHSQRASAVSVATTTDAAASNVFRDLEEQNRLLQERLTSQQTMLDRLLSRKLSDATENSTAPANTRKQTDRGTQDQMIKLHDHFKPSDLRVRTEQFDDLEQVEKVVAQRHPLSPTAA